MSFIERLFGRRRVAAQPAAQLLSDAIRAVTHECKVSAPTLEGAAMPLMRVPDAHSIDVWYSVETNDDLSAARRAGLENSLDEKTRDLLARNGYLRATGQVVFVSLHSRQEIKEAGQYYLR